MQSIIAWILRPYNKIQPKKGNPLYFPGNDMLLIYKNIVATEESVVEFESPWFNEENSVLEKLLLLSGVVLKILAQIETHSSVFHRQSWPWTQGQLTQTKKFSSPYYLTKIPLTQIL